MTILGALIALALMCFGYKPHRFHYNIYFKVGKNWGGFELGGFFIVCENASLSTLQHEAGHGIQNLMFGIFMPFIISIPSAIRYWHRELKYERKSKQPPTNYDDIWFEGWATKLGKKYFKGD